MPDKKKATTFASLAVAGLIVAGGATAAINANADTSTATNGSGYGAPAGYGQEGHGPGGDSQRGDGQRGGSHTAVTGTEKTQVTDAVKAKDSAVTVTDVQKDADGSYDVHGTKAGKQVMVEVSKDLKTIEVRTFDGTHGGPGGHHGHGTEVTGAELTTVKAAVVAKNAGVTVEHVVKESDGTYRAMGTKSGNRVMYKVSKDLKTITADTRGPRDGKGPQGVAPSAAPSTPA